MTAVPSNVSNLNVAVILVNWNNWRDTVECLDALLAQRHEQIHVFVVDNLSSDQSVEEIFRWCSAPRALSGWRELPGVRRYTDPMGGKLEPIAVRFMDMAQPQGQPPPPGCRLTLVQSGANRGFASGCNVGLAAAGLHQFDYFWFLNTDTVVDANALTALLHRSAQRPSHGLLGSTLLYYDAPDTVQALSGGRLDRKTMTTRHIGEGTRLGEVRESVDTVEASLAHVCGASMFASQRFIREIGPMQEDYFLYYEEYDWAMRARGRYSLGYAPDSRVFHKSGASSSKVMPLFTSRLFYRNRIRFMSRFYPEHLGTIKRGLMVELLRKTLGGHWVLARAVAETLWLAGRLSRDVSTNV
jgi:GT2 family glycosyltransferase